MEVVCSLTAVDVLQHISVDFTFSFVVLVSMFTVVDCLQFVENDVCCALRGLEVLNGNQL